MKSSAKRSKLEIRARIRWSAFAPFQRIFAAFASTHLPGREVLAELDLVGAQRMRRLNREWRAIDKPTDVLSLECALPAIGPILLGPVYLCPEVAKNGATPAERSLDYLFAHGLLHTLGWDHRDAVAEKNMDEHVRRILKKAGRRAPDSMGVPR